MFNGSRIQIWIFSTLAFTGFAAVAMIVGIVLWMSSATNQVALDDSRRHFDSALKAETESLGVSTEDYANWDEAYEWVINRDDAALYSNLGTGATENRTFDLIYIVEPNGRALYAYQTGGEASDTSIIDQSLVDPLLAALAPLQNQPYQIVDNYAALGDQTAILSAGRVQPFDAENTSLATLPIFIGGIILTEEKLSEIGAQLMAESVSLVGTDQIVRDGFASMPLTDIDGNTVAQLIWTAPRPGDRLLSRSQPIIAAVSLILLIGNLIVGRSSAKQAGAFMRERTNARTDHLTGLINRKGLHDLIKRPDVAGAMGDGNAAVIFVDMNDFKKLNDTVGHEAGDLAFQVTAERLRSSVRKTDYVARIGGDEFICLIIDDSPTQAAEFVSDRIFARTEAPINIGDFVYDVKPSVGVAIAERGLSWDMLLIRADTAMYLAKRKSLAQPVFFNKSMKTNHTEDRGEVVNIRRA